MKRTIRFFLTMLFLVLGTAFSWADFKDFSIIVNNQEGTLLTAEEQVQGTAFEFGVAVNSDGTTVRVPVGDATSVATVSGKFHSDHGSNNLKVVVPVEGGVKVTFGNCTFNGGKYSLVAADGTKVEAEPSEKACWKNGHTSVTEVYYAGGATTLTINGNSYTPYIKVEKSEYVPTKYQVTYIEDPDPTVEGETPASFTWTEGDKFVLPLNRSMYKEGTTLTDWVVLKAPTFTEENIICFVKPGEEYTPACDIYLAPVWTVNITSLDKREAPVTLKWDFQRKNGAPTLAYEGKDGLIYVTQANVNGENIDVKLDYSTKNGGKVANANWNDWCQMNSGTKFTIPSCKGAVVSIEAYSAPTTTTIDGQTDYTATGNTISYTVGNPADAIDIVIGDGSYYRYIQTVLPVVETPGGKTYKNEPTTAFWAMDAIDNVAATTAPADALSMTSLNSGDLTITGMGSCTDGDAKAVSGVSLVKYKPAGATKEVEWSLRPAAGLTFTPTKISGYCNRYGTDAENCVVLTMKTDEKSEAIATFTALRNGKTTAQKPYDATAKYMFEIELTAEQQAALTTTGILSLTGKVGVAEGKELGYGQIKIEGTVSGTIADVNKYTVSIAAAPEEGGAVSIYPKADEYTENDEVQLTATENFGYDFVNWTNAAGEEVSTEAKCKVTVTADETYTANFVKVNTHELAVAIDGGANDYMVSLNPAPVVVEGKKMYEEGTKVTITAAENTILTFTNWSDGQTEKEIVYTMDEDKSVTANYSAIDFIVGWDFMQAGNNSRKADFFAAENDAVTLDMRKEDGSIVGWLDKSQFGQGGYEGRPGGVCWVQGATDGDVGNCYWQTKVNAEAFSDIKVVTSMVYNYNAYQTYNVEVSTDGENWEKAGSINMPGAKNWTDATINLATKYSNQKELFIRWIADKTSNVDGTASKNDGACIGATYILATAKLIDDGTAPVLVSTVPAEGADNASANGKIVLTFDEKVKVADNAVATINGTQLKPVVSGKTVTFEYKSLEYSTAYTFTLPANSVADLTDNYITTPISINFQTKTKPTIEKGMYDIILQLTDDEGNDYTAEQIGKQFADAIAIANKRTDQNKRFRILVPPTTIKIPAYDSDVTVTVELADGSTVQKTYKEPRTYITGNNISIIGLDYEKTIITNSTPTETYAGKYGNANISEGIGNNDVLQISGTGTYFQGVTIKTGIGDALGRDIAVQDKGNKTIFKNARLWGYQDTYTNNSGKGRTYFEGGVVRGRTDYLCGKADIWFEGVTLQQCGQGGYPIVPSTPKQYGWIFNRCTLTPESSNVTCTLGRPWGSGTPIALLINTTMEVVPGAEGWSEMSGGWPKRFAEYNSMTKSGTVIDLTSRKRTFGGKENCNDPILTAAEASEYSIAKVMGSDDDWDPTAATEQASAPTNAVYKDGIATWDNSDYVLGWIIFIEDEPFVYVTENTFDIKQFIENTPAAKAKAAMATKALADGDTELKAYIAGVNEMGGIGEKVEILPATPTGIKNSIINGSANASEMFNIAGQKVSKDANGIVINNGKKVIK